MTKLRTANAALLDSVDKLRVKLESAENAVILEREGVKAAQMESSAAMASMVDQVTHMETNMTQARPCWHPFF